LKISLKISTGYYPTGTLSRVDWRALRRIGLAVIVLAVALILASVGVPGAVEVAIVALVALFVIGFRARWPWQL